METKMELIFSIVWWKSVPANSFSVVHIRQYVWKSDKENKSHEKLFKVSINFS